MAYHHRARGKDKDSAKLRRMAYKNKNFLKKREAAVRLARLHYEPGRQDRNYKWVWRKYIYPHPWSSFTG